MACGIVMGLIALEEEGAAAMGHVVAVFVEIGAADAGAAAYCYLIGALLLAATVVPRYE